MAHLKDPSSQKPPIRQALAQKLPRRLHKTLSQTFGANLHHNLNAVLDAILPPHSLLTGQRLVTADIDADTELWQKLKFIDDPCCNACGYPFEFLQGEQAICISCQTFSPVFARARSAIAYDEVSRKLILDFKHGGRTDGLDFFAAQMLRVGRSLLTDADMLIPVPLHPKRLRQRKFNQAALLARSLSGLMPVPYETEILMRTKNTRSQGGQTFLGRRRNVAGAFGLSSKNLAHIKGRHVVLIDDVYTTGSTLSACAKTLKRAGVAQVDALTLMRVVRPIEITKRKNLK